MYSVGKFAKKIGKSVKTIQRWDRDGKLVASRTPTGRRYYTEDQYFEYLGQNTPNKLTIAYLRVSNQNQKDDLKNQKEYVADFCRNAGISIDEYYTDIGSGLNFKRKYFNLLMEQVALGSIHKIVLAHKDRLVRFGFDWFQAYCSRYGTQVVLINDERLSPTEEIVKDLVAIIHVFSSRVYGLRKYKKGVASEGQPSTQPTTIQPQTTN